MTASRASQSFSPVDRLHRSFEFRRLRRSGARVQSDHFVVYAGELKGDNHSRLGVTVSRRIGNAVVRNRLKRRVRECFRLLLRPAVPAGTSLLVIALPGAGELKMSAVTAELAAATRNAMKKSRKGRG